METPQARNRLKNAARTHHPLHAVLGIFVLCKTRSLIKDDSLELTKLLHILFVFTIAEKDFLKD